MSKVSTHCIPRKFYGQAMDLGLKVALTNAESVAGYHDLILSFGGLRSCSRDGEAFFALFSEPDDQPAPLTQRTPYAPEGVISVRETASWFEDEAGRQELRLARSA